MPLREDILTPIPGDNPSGANLRHAPIYEQIKEARRQEAADPQGDWEREIKTANYEAVIKLSQDTLATQSKDLQLAVWLAEALIYQEQAMGLCSGLTLLRDLTETFWDSLYPELEDGDAEFRATPLEWFGNYFDPSKGSSPAMAIRSIAMTRSGLDWFQYKVSRSVPSDADAQASEVKAETRRTAVAEGKLTPEEFDSAFRDTPKPFYRKLESDFKTAAENLEAFDRLCQEKFGNDGPGFRELRRALEEVSSSARILLADKLKMDPDPVAAPEAPAGGVEGLDAVASDGVPAEGFEISGNLELRTRQDAVRILIASARFMRRSDPSDAVPYLMVRALRWGELRAANGDIAGSLLEAPPADIRMALRNSALAADWNKVLEIAESAAASGCGRGWLDLHRYTIRACDELGHAGVARTLRSGLKALLADLPQLPTLTLADDTGTANPETMEWLIRESLFTPAAPGRPVANRSGGIITLPLLDRLTDEDPKRREEVPLSRSRSLAAFKIAVRRDLEWLLNTRRAERDLPPQVASSVFTFGLPEPSTMTEDRTQLFLELARRMEAAIAIFEPRLVGAKVTLSPHQDTTTRRIDLIIEGLLRIDPSPEHVSFDTSLELTNGEYHVTGEAGA